MAAPTCQSVQIEHLQAEIDRLERGTAAPSTRGWLSPKPADSAESASKLAGRDHSHPQRTGTTRWDESGGKPSEGQAEESYPAEALGPLAQPGMLVEWLADGPGTGVDTLALLTARSAVASDGVLVVIDRRGEFYPPAAVGMGIDPRRMILLRPDTLADQSWAWDQSLRCPAVTAVLGWPRQLDDRTFRRLQLAAEEGRTLGLLVRPLEARAEPSWATARLLVTPLRSRRETGVGSRRLRVEVLRNRTGRQMGHFTVEIDDETHRLSVATG